MNPLEWRHLVRICDKYGIDHYEIDSGISYYENKEHLMGIVRMIDGCLDVWELARMSEQQEKYMAENPLEFYASYRLADKVFGESARAEFGEPDTSPQRFSLRTMTETGFSLRMLVKSNG